MATLINDVEVETFNAYGVEFADGEIVELDSLEEATGIAQFLPGAKVKTSRVYMTPWVDHVPSDD